MFVYVKNLNFALILSISSIVLAIFLKLKFDVVGFSFLINTLICIFLIGFVAQKTINILLFYLIFNLIFMSYIPWINYSNSSLIWVSSDFEIRDYLIANIFICLFSFMVLFFYRLFPVSNSDNLKELGQPNFLLSLIVCVISAFIVFYNSNFDIMRVFFRGLDGDVYESVNANPLFSIFVMLARLIPAFILMRYLVCKKKIKSIIIFLFVLFCAFPTGVARFLVAFIYLPLFLIVFDRFRRSIYISLLLILSIIYLFPFLNQFRYFSINQKISILPELSFFNQAHFDAYQNFVDVLRTDFVTYGNQLIGVLFFFIPRVFWVNKPSGSGYQLAINNNYAFTNISMPFIGESYVNFSYFGFLIFPAFLAFLMKKIDSKFLINSVNIDYNYCKGVFFCSAIFFVLRGDLMSSFSFLLAGVVAYKFVEKM
ncbi:oligosaccharide repeat unit polymerase [Acinetobacter sp. ANC 4277]|uniref:O-antigen polymerase n=1 Tax=Acinetobacter terrae TaxID=2731247 RepID=UPI00148FDA5D|nr:O-antigen polymerase [Acinetobacter terrae]NNG75320.1 oligosaccharide repeat unit polymerase [Acinetobacter terrae]